MNVTLSDMIFYCGCLQVCVLLGSVTVPVQLNWKETFKVLPKLVRQLYWTYGFYTAFSICSLGVISILASEQIADGSVLSNAFAVYVMLFWGIRLCLQCVLDAKEHLTKWWLTLGYHGLTVTFIIVTGTFGYTAFRGICGG